MAKKKSAEASEPSTSAAPPAAVTSTTPAEPEVARVDAAFAAGNYSMVRAIAASATSSPPARERAQALMPKIVVEQAQALPAVAAILVLCIVAALVLTTG